MMISFRNITDADRDDVLSIHRQSIFGLCRDHYSQQEMKAWTDGLTPELFAQGMKDDSNVGVVAVASNTIIAYGFINVKNRELRALYVMPEHKGRGVGRLIMSRLEDMAMERGISRLSLQSTLNAVGFYEKSGYQVIKPERHRISDEISIACVRMEKDLRGRRVNINRILGQRCT